MRLRNIVIGVMVILGVALVYGADKFVTPKKEGVGIYKNEIREVYEEPLFTVGSNDRLTVIKKKGNRYQVKTADGRTGWVDENDVVVVGKSKTFVFDNADVIGYLDNPTPVYIIDVNDPNADPINLDRSFKDALRENVDKETVQRQVK